MADFPVPASVLGDPGLLENHKRRIFERMEIRDRLGHRTPYIPHRFQAEAHYPGRHLTHQSLACGRRGGKSKFAEAEATAMMAIEGTATWVGAPTYTLTDRVFQPLFKSIAIEKIFGVEPAKARNSSAMRYIEMPWGAVVEGKSAERPASSKGASLDLFIDDECAEHGERYFTEYVGPGLADRQGRAIFTSTPLGLTWFHKYFERGLKKKYRDLGWLSHTWRSEDNPHLDRAWLMQQKAVVSDHVWRQEYCAEFLARSGMIWEDYRDEYHQGPQSGHLFNEDTHPVDPLWTHYRSIDIGFNHPTACVWFAVDPHNNIWVYDEYLATSSLHRDHAKAISTKTRYPVTDTFISWEAGKADGKGGPTVLQVYQEAGVYARPAPKAFDLRIASVAAYMRSTLEDRPVHPAIFISDRCTRLRHQIQQYRWKDLGERQAAGKPTPHRKGVDDDLCDALGMGCISKPTYAPTWIQEEAEDRFVTRYGYQNSAFARQETPADIRGIPGLATLPRIN